MCREHKVECSCIAGAPIGTYGCVCVSCEYKKAVSDAYSYYSCKYACDYSDFLHGWSAAMQWRENDSVVKFADELIAELEEVVVSLRKGIDRYPSMGYLFFTRAEMAEIVIEDYVRKKLQRHMDGLNEKKSQGN